MDFKEWNWLNESRIIEANGELAMVRLFYLPVGDIVKVGIEAQSPAGEGGLRFFSDLSLEQKTVHDLRAGI